MLSGLTVNSSTVKLGLDYLLKRQVRGWSHPKTHFAGLEQGKPLLSVAD